MPLSNKCPLRAVAVLALALGVVPVRVGLGRDDPFRRPCSENWCKPLKV